MAIPSEEIGGADSMAIATYAALSVLLHRLDRDKVVDGREIIREAIETLEELTADYPGLEGSATNVLRALLSGFDSAAAHDPGELPC